MPIQEEWKKKLTARKDLVWIQNFLDEHSRADVYLVGGTVRDVLLSRVSSHETGDLDIVIGHCSAKEITAWFEHRGTINWVGSKFGVFKFRPRGEMSPMDLALPRTEQAYPHSRGGTREFTIVSDPDLPIKKDLARRDFTINAMAFDVRRQKLIDPFHGQKDLAKKTLRAVGKPFDRFSEDLSRVLRGIRFAVQLNFSIEKKTLKAMQAIAPRLNDIRNGNFLVAREVKGSELAKSFFTGPEHTIRLLREVMAFDLFFPAITLLLRLDPYYLDALISSPDFSTAPLTLSLALLLRGMTDQEVHETLERTGLNTLPHGSLFFVDMETVLWLIHRLQDHPSVREISTMPASKFEKLFLNEKGLIYFKALERLQETARAKAAESRRVEILSRWHVKNSEPIPPLVRGDDVLRMGVPAGIRVREMLNAARDRQLDGQLLTREAALLWMKQEIH